MRIFFSRISFRRRFGILVQAVSGLSSDSQTKAPPSAIPSSGFVWVKAFGSQQRTTLTWRRSQLTRIRSGATTRKYSVGAPFFSDPYFGFAETWTTSFSRPSSSTAPSRSATCSPSSPMISPRFFPVVIIPQPPIEWRRTAMAPWGRSDGRSAAFTSYGWSTPTTKRVVPSAAVFPSFLASVPAAKPYAPRTPSGRKSREPRP